MKVMSLNNLLKNQFFQFLIKASLSILLLLFISNFIVKKHDWLALANHFDQLNLQHFIYLVIILLLVPVNWIIESLKWKKLIQKLEKVSLNQAFKATLTGLAISLITPNRTGEYFGRIIHLQSANRIQAALVTVLNNFSQLIVTLVIGTVSVVILTFRFELIYPAYNFLKVPLMFMSLLSIFLALFFYYSSGKLRFLFSGKKKWGRLFIYYTEVLDKFSTKDLNLAILLSLVRYSMFTAQWYFAFLLFDVSITLSEAIILIPSCFFVMTIIPTVALAEIGIRESVAIAIIGIVNSNYASITASTMVIWILNLAIPALLGSLFILRAKIFGKTKIPVKA